MTSTTESGASAGRSSFESPGAERQAGVLAEIAVRRDDIEAVAWGVKERGFYKKISNCQVIF